MPHAGLGPINESSDPCTKHKIALTESQQPNTEQDRSCTMYHKENVTTHSSTYTLIWHKEAAQCKTPVTSQPGPQLHHTCNTKEDSRQA
jgi:hypothetical protein